MKEQPPPEKNAIRADRRLIEGCLEALEELVPVEDRLAWDVTGPGTGPQTDTQLVLQLGGRRVPFAVEVRRRLRPEQVGPITHHVRNRRAQGQQVLICADRVPERIGKPLRDQGVLYLDLGGNAFLRGPGLLLLVVGRRRTQRKADRTHLTGTQVRLLGVFLRDPDAGRAVLVDLAARAGIALGAVGAGRERLAELHILERVEDRHWRVANRAEGLKRFGEGWAARVRHKLEPRRYRMLRPTQGKPLEQRLADAPPELGCLLGGERAAGHLTQFLETEHATVHVRPGEQRNAADHLLLAPDEEGPVTLLERYGEGDEVRLPSLPGVPLAHPLLVWAECQTIPDERVAETVERLHVEYLEQDPV